MFSGVHFMKNAEYDFLILKETHVFLAFKTYSI